MYDPKREKASNICDYMGWDYDIGKTPTTEYLKIHKPDFSGTIRPDDLKENRGIQAQVLSELATDGKYLNFIDYLYCETEADFRILENGANDVRTLLLIDPEYIFEAIHLTISEAS